MTQAALARLVFGLDPTTCVSAPRIYTDGVALMVDPGVSQAVRDELAAAGETVQNETVLGTAVQMVAIERGPELRLSAASDPRKDGVALVR